MLPSTSSPIESSAAPVPLPCHSHNASEGQAAVSTTAPGDENYHQTPPTASLVSGAWGGRRQDIVKPPDLCASGGGEIQNTPTPTTTNWGSTKAECLTDERYCVEADIVNVRRAVGASGEMEECDESLMGERAWEGSHPHSPSDHNPETASGNTTMGSLPDLCDTSSGVHGRLHHLSHGIVNDCDAPHSSNSSPSQSQSLRGDQVHRLSCSENDLENAPTLSQFSQENVIVVAVREDNEGNSSVREQSLDEMVNEGQERLSRNPSDDLVMYEEESGEVDMTNKELEHSDTGNNTLRTEDSDDLSVRSKDRVASEEQWDMETSSLVGEEYNSSGPVEQYLVHDTQRICLVACGVTQCDTTGPNSQDISMADVSENEGNAQEPGLGFISHNLHHSSHPMFNKWPCYFYITQDHLPTFSIDSHGRHIGSEAPIFFPSASSTQATSGLTEEEQVKMAKRMGLITHLPCGTFDESKKSGECVICMIDFSVGDQVRYLPCMHTYHTQCIDDWLMRSFTCPSCLEPVDAALLNTYGSS
ncbi:hypothetical protein Pmani_015137 [Petrolisthes manimaculis]|uniref:RING-type domain-containing protein n=1 Tax=Petrolisthes manimaculis TaxID=1843537 RepID=A0AAE1PV24_9EUCA|nr:hypothetical protein Pmani_015137 [Petrolisthes manimaculis]